MEEWVGRAVNTGPDEGLLKAQSPPPVTHLLRQGHTSYTFPNSSTNGGSSIQTCEPMGFMLTQTTTPFTQNPSSPAPSTWLHPFFKCWLINSDNASMPFPGWSHNYRLAAGWTQAWSPWNSIALISFLPVGCQVCSGVQRRLRWNSMEEMYQKFNFAQTLGSFTVRKSTYHEPILSIHSHDSTSQASSRLLSVSGLWTLGNCFEMPESVRGASLLNISGPQRWL